MPVDTPQLRTPGVIAAELGVSLNRVLHILRTRRHIRLSAAPAPYACMTAELWQWFGMS